MDHDHHILEDPIEELCDTLTTLQDASEIRRFLSDLCTPQELNALAERWRICKLLAQGNLSYREIHALTGASLVTIGRVARFLKHEQVKGYKTALDLLHKKAKLNE